MAHLATSAIGDILDHYADVIEGGNAYASGSSFNGVPGLYSRDPGLLSGDDTPLTATAAGDTTTIVVAGKSWVSNRWVRADAPPFFLLCTSGAEGSTNKARRITGWDNATTSFTVDAFPVAPGDEAVFTVLEGFKRLPNTIDVNAGETESPQGYDRRVSLSLLPSERLDWFGNGTETWEGRLRVVLRLLKHARLHDWQASLAENLQILATALPLTREAEHRDATYVRALLAPDGEPDVVIDDQHKVVAALSFPIIYRVERGF